MCPQAGHGAPRPARRNSPRSAKSPAGGRIAASAAASKGTPIVWAIMIAFVRGVTAASMASTAGTYVPNSTSTNTGTARFWMIGLTVVGKPAATVITSSPGRKRRSPSDGESSALKATRLAEEPELTNSAVSSSIRAASPASNPSEYRPAVNQKSRLASTALINSLASKTRPAYRTSFRRHERRLENASR